MEPDFTKPECYTPEDNPYPLCVGNDSEECKSCCIFTDFEMYNKEDN